MNLSQVSECASSEGSISTSLPTYLSILSKTCLCPPWRLVKWGSHCYNNPKEREAFGVLKNRKKSNWLIDACSLRGVRRKVGGSFFFCFLLHAETLFLFQKWSLANGKCLWMSSKKASGLLGGKLEIYSLSLSFLSRFSVYRSTRSKRMHCIPMLWKREQGVWRSESTEVQSFNHNAFRPYGKDHQRGDNIGNRDSLNYVQLISFHYVFSFLCRMRLNGSDQENS